MEMGRKGDVGTSKYANYKEAGKPLSSDSPSTSSEKEFILDKPGN